MEQRHWNQITRINIAINRQVAVVFDSSNDLNARDILFISSISWFGVLVMQGTFANCQHVSSWEKFSASNIFSWNVNISFNNLGYIFHLWKSDKMYVFGWFLTVPTCIPSIFLLVLAGIFLWTPALSIDNFFPNFWKEIYISENIPFSFEIVRDVGYVPVLKVDAHGAHVRGTKESWGDPKAGWLFLYLFSVKLAGLLSNKCIRTELE